ncbi:MAG: 30S ribosomal protein S6 [Sumerlaeia bacterium]
MSKYELVVVHEPNLVEDQYNSELEAVEKVITANGGEVLDKDIWGKRRLAYQINKRREGRYTLYHFTCESEGKCLPELNRALRIDENVLRFLVTKAVEAKTRGEIPEAIQKGDRRFSFGGRSYAETRRGQEAEAPVDSPTAALEETKREQAKEREAARERERADFAAATAAQQAAAAPAEASPEAAEATPQAPEAAPETAPEAAPEAEAAPKAPES